MKDLINVKKDFPLFENNPGLVYLDSAATSVKPKCVIDKINEYYSQYGVNVNRGVYDLSYEATTKYEETREEVAKFLNARSKEIVFTKGASDSLNLVALSFGEMVLKPGDEIITCELEHHSSFLPWQHLASKIGCKMVFVPLDENNNITVDNFKKVLTDKTKIVALNYASNVIGTVTPIKEIIALAHEKGAYVSVDAAQSAPHMKTDVKDLDCDFLSLSAHKMLGPTGLGILYGKYKHLKKMVPQDFGGDMIDEVYKDYSTYKDPPFCFEVGTPQIAEVIAFREAINYINNLGFEKIKAQTNLVSTYAYNELKKLDGIEVYTKKEDSPIISFNLKNVHAHDASTVFNEHHVCLRAGHHCAQLITRKLGVPGTLRASFYFYNTLSDAKEFIEAAKAACEYFKEW